MIGYDFDKTIYKKDSSTEFFFYMIFSRPYLLLFAPYFLVVFALYGMKIMAKYHNGTEKDIMVLLMNGHKNITLLEFKATI